MIKMEVEEAPKMKVIGSTHHKTRETGEAKGRTTMRSCLKV